MRQDESEQPQVVVADAHDEARKQRMTGEKENGRRVRAAAELVEAAGQRFHPFRGGLDYAFIPFGMRGVLSACGGS